MKCSCKFLLLIFVPVGVVVSCTEPPNPQMAELQRYYALKGDGINPPIKRVALKTTGQAGAMPDQKTAPVLSTTNAPLSTTNNVPALSTTNVPALHAKSSLPYTRRMLRRRSPRAQTLRLCLSGSAP